MEKLCGTGTEPLCSTVMVWVCTPAGTRQLMEVSVASTVVTVVLVHSAPPMKTSAGVVSPDEEAARRPPMPEPCRTMACRCGHLSANGRAQQRHAPRRLRAGR